MLVITIWNVYLIEYINCFNNVCSSDVLLEFGYQHYLNDNNKATSVLLV